MEVGVAKKTVKNEFLENWIGVFSFHTPDPIPIFNSEYSLVKQIALTQKP